MENHIDLSDLLRRIELLEEEVNILKAQKPRSTTSFPDISNYRNFESIIDEWIFDNLYLWGTIKVSKIEHKKDNILRNKNTLDQKINFEHYKILSINDLISEI